MGGRDGREEVFFVTFIPSLVSTIAFLRKGKGEMSGRGACVEENGPISRWMDGWMGGSAWKASLFFYIYSYLNCQLIS